MLSVRQRISEPCRRDAMQMAKDLRSKDLHNDARFQEWLNGIGEADVGELIRFSLYLAVLERASDLHIKPYERRVGVLLRRDGELEEAFSFSGKWHDQCLRLIKNWAHLPSYRQGVPQEGRLTIPFGSQELFIRVAVFPTVLGEKVVCRVLNFKEGIRSLDELGMSPSMLKTYQDLLREKRGMVVLCGPAGSGKTTTLYASLLWLARQAGPVKNVATIEDPVEYIVEEFNQAEVNPNIGFTFALGLRSLLRQDPNILAVGEIRDPETALTALQAGLTGHLILATLHAHDARGAVARLEQFGASRAIITMSVTAVLHQQLVGKACGACEMKGCEACRYRGRKGLTGNFELLRDHPS